MPRAPVQGIVSLMSARSKNALTARSRNIVDLKEQLAARDLEVQQLQMALGGNSPSKLGGAPKNPDKLGRRNAELEQKVASLELQVAKHKRARRGFIGNQQKSGAFMTFFGKLHIYLFMPCIFLLLALWVLTGATFFAILYVPMVLVNAAILALLYRFLLSTWLMSKAYIRQSQVRTLNKYIAVRNNLNEEFLKLAKRERVIKKAKLTQPKTWAYLIEPYVMSVLERLGKRTRAGQRSMTKKEASTKNLLKAAAVGESEQDKYTTAFWLAKNEVKGDFFLRKVKFEPLVIKKANRSWLSRVWEWLESGCSSSALAVVRNMDEEEEGTREETVAKINEEARRQAEVDQTHERLVRDSIMDSQAERSLLVMAKLIDSMFWWLEGRPTRIFPVFKLFSGLGTFYAFSGESSREYDLKRAEQEKEALQLCTRLLKNDYRDEMSQMLIQLEEHKRKLKSAKASNKRQFWTNLKNLLCCRRSASHSVSYFKKQDQRKGVYEQMQGELAAETIQRLLRDRRTGLGTRWEQLKNGEKHAKEQTVNGLRWTDLGHFKQATLMELDWRPEEGLPPEVAMEREKNKKLADLLSQRIEERLVRLETETKDMGFDKKKAKIYDELHKNLLEEEDLNKIGFDKIPPGVCIQVAMRKVEGVNLYDKGFKAENMVSEANAKKAKERESKAGDKKTSDEEESQGGEQAAPADPIETPEWLRKVDAMYKAIDSDGSGRVQEHEFVKLRMIGVKMTEEELSALFHLVDIEDGDQNGELDYEEFKALCKKDRDDCKKLLSFADVVEKRMGELKVVYRYFRPATLGRRIEAKDLEKVLAKEMRRKGLRTLTGGMVTLELADDKIKEWRGVHFQYDDFIEVAVDDKTYYFSPRVAKLKKKPRYIQFLASIGNSTIVNNLRTLIFAQQKHENHPERYKELRGKLISHLEQEADRFEMMFEPRFNATSKMLSLVRGRGASNKKNRAPALDHPSPEEIFHEAVNEIMTGSGMNAQFMSIQAATKAFAKDDVSAKEVIASAMRQAKEAGASQDDVFKYAAWAYVRATNSLQLEDKHQQEKMDEYVTHDVEILRAKPGLPGLDDAGGRETQLRSELLKENDLVNVDKLRTKYLVNMFEKDTGQVEDIKRELASKSPAKQRPGQSNVGLKWMMLDKRPAYGAALSVTSEYKKDAEHLQSPVDKLVQHLTFEHDEDLMSKPHDLSEEEIKKLVRTLKVREDTYIISPEKKRVHGKLQQVYFSPVPAEVSHMIDLVEVENKLDHEAVLKLDDIVKDERRVVRRELTQLAAEAYDAGVNSGWDTERHTIKRKAASKPSVLAGVNYSFHQILAKDFFGQELDDNKQASSPGRRGSAQNSPGRRGSVQNSPGKHKFDFEELSQKAKAAYEKPAKDQHEFEMNVAMEIYKALKLQGVKGEDRKKREEEFQAKDVTPNDALVVARVIMLTDGLNKDAKVGRLASSWLLNNPLSVFIFAKIAKKVQKFSDSQGASTSLISSNPPSPPGSPISTPPPSPPRSPPAAADSGDIEMGHGADIVDEEMRPAAVLVPDDDAKTPDKRAPASVSWPGGMGLGMPQPLPPKTPVAKAKGTSGGTGTRDQHGQLDPEAHKAAEAILVERVRSRVNMEVEIMREDYQRQATDAVTIRYARFNGVVFGFVLPTIMLAPMLLFSTLTAYNAYAGGDTLGLVATLYEFCFESVISFFQYITGFVMIWKFQLPTAFDISLPGSTEELLEALERIVDGFSMVMGRTSNDAVPANEKDVAQTISHLNGMNLVIAVAKLATTYGNEIFSQVQKIIKLFANLKVTTLPENIQFKVIAQGTYDPAKKEKERLEREARARRDEVRFSAEKSCEQWYEQAIKDDDLNRLQNLKEQVKLSYKNNPLTPEAFKIDDDGGADEIQAREDRELVVRDKQRSMQQAAINTRIAVRNKLRSSVEETATSKARDMYRTAIYERKPRTVCEKESREELLKVVVDDRLVAAIHADDRHDGMDTMEAWRLTVVKKFQEEVVSAVQQQVTGDRRKNVDYRAWHHFKENNKDGETITYADTGIRLRKLSLRQATGEQLLEAASSMRENKTVGVLIELWKAYVNDLNAIPDAEAGTPGDVDHHIKSEHVLILTADAVLGDFALDLVLRLSASCKQLKNRFAEEAQKPVFVAASRYELLESTEMLRDAATIEEEVYFNTVHYTDEVSRQEVAIKAAEAFGLESFLDEGASASETSQEMREAQDKLKRSREALKIKSELEMKDAAAPLHLNTDEARLETAIEQGKYWLADKDKIDAAQQKLDDARAAKQAFAELKDAYQGTKAKRVGSAGEEGEANIYRLQRALTGEATRDGIQPLPFQDPRIIGFVREAPQGDVAWTEGKAVLDRWYQERKEKAQADLQARMVQDKYTVDLAEFARRVSEAEKWFVDEEGPFGQIAGRARQQKAQRAQAALKDLREKTRTNRFAVDVPAFTTCIATAKEVDSDLEFEDKSIESEIQQGEARRDVAQDAQKKLMSLLEQMRPVAINRKIPQLEACYEQVRVLEEAGTVTADLLRGTRNMAQHADLIPSGMNIIQAGKKSIEDAKAAERALENMVRLTKINHNDVSLDEFDAAMTEARVWDLQEHRDTQYRAAETQLNKARNAQRVRQELFAACKQPALPTELRVSTPQALKESSRSAHLLYDKIETLIADGERWEMYEKDLKVGRDRKSNIREAWRKKVGESIGEYMQQARDATPLHVDEDSVNCAKDAYLPWFGEDQNTREADKLVADAREAKGAFSTLKQHSTKDPGNSNSSSYFKASNGRLEDLEQAIETLDRYLSRLRSNDREQVEVGRSTAQKASAAMEQRRAIMSSNFDTMKSLTAKGNSMSVSEFQDGGALDMAITQVEKYNDEFDLAKKGGFMSKGDVSKAKKARKKAEDHFEKESRKA